MNEIQRRAESAKGWRILLDITATKGHSEWCVCIGLCETAGWVNNVGYGMLEWVKPGHKDI